MASVQELPVVYRSRALFPHVYLVPWHCNILRNIDEFSMSDQVEIVGKITL